MQYTSKLNLLILGYLLKIGELLKEALFLIGMEKNLLLQKMKGYKVNFIQLKL